MYGGNNIIVTLKQPLPQKKRSKLKKENVYVKYVMACSASIIIVRKSNYMYVIVSGNRK